MTKFSYAWFIEQSREARKNIEETWPKTAKDNAFVASASLPVLTDKTAQPNQRQESAAELQAQKVHEN